MYFKLLKSRKNRKVLIILSLSFLVFCIWIFLIADKILAVSVSAVSLILILLLFFESVKPGWSYSVESGGIRIKRTFKKYFISFKNIDKVKEISRSQTAKMVNKVIAGKSDSALGSRIELGRLIGYSSVPVTEAAVKDIYSSGSDKLYIDKFVLIQKKEGGSYILTPSDPSGFVRECGKYIIK